MALHTHAPMGRTNIVIDDELMEEVLRVSGIKTRREAVDTALRFYLNRARQLEILNYFGKLPWDGDLDEMRTDR